MPDRPGGSPEKKAALPIDDPLAFLPRRRFPGGVVLGSILILLTIGATLFVLHPWKMTSPSGGRNFRTVVIDAGHGGHDSGAIGNGIREKDLCLDVAQRLASLLQEKGIRTVLTRSDDRFIPLSQRARIANREKNSIFISIHFNQTDNRVAAGIETWQAVAKSGNPADDLLSFLHLAENTPSDLRENCLARAVQEELIATTGALDRGVKQRNFYVVRNVHSPAVLVEGGFVSNPRTARLLQSKTYRHKLASAIAGGVLKYRDGWQPAPVLLARLDQ